MSTAWALTLSVHHIRTQANQRNVKLGCLYVVAR
jgi:hypothetical protein